MKRRALVGLLGLGLNVLAGCGAHSDDGVSGAAAQTSAPGATGDLQGVERKAFLDAVRAEFFRQVGRSTPSVEFVVDALKVGNGAGGGPFGFLKARPVKPGTTIDYDYHGTPIQADFEDQSREGNTTFATLKKVEGSWLLLELDISPIDEPWIDMPCSWGAPASIYAGVVADVNDGCDNPLPPTPLQPGDFKMLTTDAGAMLTVKVTGPRGALFDLDVLGGLGTKHGALTGVVAEFVGGDQEYSASAGLDCLLHLKTSGTRIDVVQEGSCKNEGFSDSLSASGDYHPK